MNADQPVRDARTVDDAERWGDELDRRRDHRAALNVLASVLGVLALVAVMAYFAAVAIGAAVHWWTTPIAPAPEPRPTYAPAATSTLSPAPVSPEPGRPVPARTLMERAHSARVTS